MKKFKILLVDDNRPFLKALEIQLQDIMNDQIEMIDLAFDGEEAIRKVTGNSYDIIFMDVEMPVMDGITATKHINIHYPYTKIIGISFNNNLSILTKMIEAGSRMFISKDEIDEEKIRHAFSLVVN